MKYRELSKLEQAVARILLINRLNDMEREQAADAGKRPQPYHMTSPLFDQVLPDMEFERYVDENGSRRLRME